MEDSNEAIKDKLKEQLEQSGISSIVRRMVHRICDDKEDLSEINLDEVVKEVYRQGGMKDFIENLSPRQGRTGRRKTSGDSYELHAENILKKHPTWIANRDDTSDEDIIEENLRKSGKYYLKMQIEGGKAFLDHLSDENSPQHTAAPLPAFKSLKEEDMHKSKLILHVFYKSQRFSTKPVVSCCDPDFKETFLIEIGRFTAVNKSAVAKELLSINEALRIIVVREDVNLHALSAIPVAYCRHDWRTILITDNGFKNFSLELMGIGPEHNVCVGILRVRFTLIPLPQERISENAFLDKANEDGATQEDFERLVISKARRWWKEYLEIRIDHQFRLVRLFAYDENMVARPVTTFIKSICFEELLVTPFQAAWFVGLIPTTKTNLVNASNLMQNSTSGGKSLPGIQNGTGGCILSERYQNVETTLVSKSGTTEDHAILLASILMEFGLDAYVAFGTKKRMGSWAWTVTLNENQEPTFWESTTGEYYDHYSIPNDTGSYKHLHPSTITRLAQNNYYGFLSISCLFNRKALYANIQPTISTDFVDWNLENPSKWKMLSYEDLPRVSQYPVRIVGPTLNGEFAAKKLEFQLRNLVVSVRREMGKGTKWNEELSKYMGQHLHREEMEVSAGGTKFTDYFRSVALKTLAHGHEFRARTFHSNTTEDYDIFSKALQEPLAKDIISPLGDSVRHALKVKTFLYPEDVVSVRLMIACTYIPV